MMVLTNTILRPETKARKWPLESTWPLAETKQQHASPSIRGFSPKPGKSPLDADCVVGLGLIGGFADYWAMPWLRSRVEVLGGFGGATGVMTNLSIDAVILLSTALTWSGGPRARYVTSGLESPYFSVTQEQSIASGLPVYNAGSGWQALGAGTQLKYRFNPTWMTYAFVEYDKLVGVTASSPIVTEPGGSSNQWTLGIGLTYTFTMTGLLF